MKALLIWPGVWPAGGGGDLCGEVRTEEGAEESGDTEEDPSSEDLLDGTDSSSSSSLVGPKKGICYIEHSDFIQ